MKTKILLYIFFITTTTWLSSCNMVVVGQGEIVETDRDIHKFSKVELDIDAEVIVTYGTDASVKIRAQKNIADAIETEMGSKTLKIKTNKSLETDEPIKIIITMNKVEGFELNGSGSFMTTNTLNATDLDLKVNGSGKLFIDAVVNNLKTDVSGSGDVKLKGSAKSHSININGSGKLFADDMMTDECDIEINGSGDVRIYVINALKVDISGSGHVLYKGNPKVKKDISGSGSVSTGE